MILLNPIFGLSTVIFKTNKDLELKFVDLKQKV